MFRFIVMCLKSLLFMPFALFKCVHMTKHRDKYDEMARYRYVQQIMNFLRRRSRTTTQYYGIDNLPKKGAYLMFANHQGKYDGLGIVCQHERPLSIIMDKSKADMIVAKQILPLVDGRPIDLNDPRQQVMTLNGVSQDIKNGKIYLIFPEGGYTDNKNTLQEFKTGVFKCAYDTKCPVIPVALIDSYKAMQGNSLKRVTTQVHYLKPIEYNEYKDLKRGQFAQLVKDRIQEAIDSYTA